MATEIALVYPVVLLLILGAVQFGVWWYASHVAHAVADAGLAAARAADANEADASQAAAGLHDQLGGDNILTGVIVEVQRDETTATVRVEGSAIQVVPGLSLPVTVELTGPVEGFTSDGG